MMNTIPTKDQLGVAIWLARHTELTTERIHALCPSIHRYKIMLLQKSEVILDEEEIDPLANSLCEEEDLANKEPATESETVYAKLISHQKRFIPSHLKSYIPGAIVWIANHNPGLKFGQIGKMFGKSAQYISKLLRSEPLPQPIDPFASQLLTKEAFEQYIKRK